MKYLFAHLSGDPEHDLDLLGAALAALHDLADAVENDETISPVQHLEALRHGVAEGIIECQRIVNEQTRA